MTTPNDVSSRVVDALYLSDSELDTSIGSPLRKVIDAVAIQIAQASNDGYLANYSYDIDSKSGGDLDDFVATYGIARMIGIRATGTLTFSRSQDIASTSVSIIPPGTQVLTSTFPSQSFQTTVSTTMDIGQTSVDIPAQAVAVGADSNILANTPLQLMGTIYGVSNVSNAAAFAGGTIDETDDQLRSRFKSTVFRNLAGTDQMYRGIALQTLANANSGSFGVAQVQVLGATTHNIEQLQMTSGAMSASITTSSYIMASSVQITDNNGAIYSPFSQYTVTVNNSVAPATLTINAVSSALMADGIYNVEYDYVPIASRNDPFNTRWNQGVVNNRVDVIVNGQNTGSATQTAVYVPSVVFTNVTSDALYHNKFVTPTGGHPTTGDVFIPLGFGPILSVPSVIHIAGSDVIDGGDFALGTDYDIVHQDDAFGYSPQSLFGLWWKTPDLTPTDRSLTFSIIYTYNTIPTQVANNLGNWRLLGTDVQVHAGRVARLLLHFAVVYNRNVNSTTVNANLKTALDAYLKRLGFSAAVQISDLIQVAHNVPGVDNIRLTTSTDNVSTYGIQKVQSDGTVITTYNSGGKPVDVYFDERTYPVLYDITCDSRARNTFS